jgi:PHD/YefM family antitoxin component YafN of YafNO toxin-antitoxin module
MNMIAAQEIKRRGMKAVDGFVGQGPVWVVKNNKAKYVVMSEEDYEQMMNDLAEARLAASENDVKAGRVKRGSSAELIREIRRGKP